MESLRRVITVLHEDTLLDAHGIAEVLVDEDVSNGEYDGCTSELESWFTHYESVAKEEIKGFREWFEAQGIVWDNVPYLEQMLLYERYGRERTDGAS